MELFLLMLLGGLTAGVGLYSVFGGKRGGEPPPPPFSSVERVVAPPKEEGVEESAIRPPMGEPVVVGRQMRDLLGRAPERVQAKFISGAGEPKKGVAPAKKALPKRPLALTYTASQILPPGSPYEHSRKALRNAETLVERQKYPEAIEVYERAKRRIDDEEIRAKIDQNIEDIRSHLSQEEKEEEEERGEALRFPEIIVPLTMQTIAIESLSEGLRSIAESLAGQVASSIERAQLPARPGEVKISDVRGIAAPIQEGGFGLDDQGLVVTEGWTDADFEREWEKFKNLPLKDRRTGDERRTGADRRTGPEAERKDRRSRKERRLADLFEERDEFLEKLEKHKKNKEEFEKNQKEREKGRGGAIPFPGFEISPGAARVEKPAISAQPAAEQVGGVVSRQKIAGEGGDLAGEIRNIQERVEEIQRRVTEQIVGEEQPSGPEGVRRPPSKGMPEEQAARPGAEIPKEGGLPPAIPPEGAIPVEPELPPGVGEGVESASPIPSLGEEEGYEEPEEPKEEEEEKKPPVQEIRGVLELKPPEEEDAPFLTLTYDFSRIPDSFKLSQNYHTMEFVYYKYKPMLMKAQEFTRRKMLKSALNYYRVIKSQNIPPEFKRMISRNIEDISEYLEKFLMRKGG